MRPKLHRDVYAGLLVIVFGLFFAKSSLAYDIGTLFHMGSGFMPLSAALLLVGVGLLIVGAALLGGVPIDDDTPVRPDWRGFFCIVAGISAFILMSERLGMVAATFACVFVSALGDRSATLRRTALFAAGVTAFCIVVFSYGLRLQLPLWPQRG